MTTDTCCAPANKRRSWSRVANNVAPDGFAELAPTLSLKALCAHYKRSPKTIRRWLADAGVSYKPYVQAKKEKPPVERKPAPRGRMVLPAAPRQAQPLLGREEEAAQFLRRVYANVHHCDERGAANPKGRFWRCGMAVMTPAELIDRASRRGWDPDAWKRIGA